MPNALMLDDAGRALLGRHADWWQRRGMLYAAVPDVPLGDLWLPLADGSEARQDLDVTPEMLDLERLAGEPQEPGPLRTHGDLFSSAAPYSRVPWVEAILGTPIRATIVGGSMRTRAFARDWAEWENLPTHRSEPWFDLLRRLTALLVERSGGRHAVVHTLMRGPSDLAEAVLGSELMCYSLYDHPAALRRFLDEATETFLAILEAQTALIPAVSSGYVNPFGIWAPGTVVRTQCDATAFLSAAQYERWFLPYDERICRAVDYSVIHLHSCSLHTVDALLAVERPQAIQVTLESEASGPSLKAMLPIFRKILGSKPLIVDGPLTAEEVHLVRDALPHDGLCLIAHQAAG